MKSLSIRELEVFKNMVARCGTEERRTLSKAFRLIATFDTEDPTPTETMPRDVRFTYVDLQRIVEGR